MYMLIGILPSLPITRSSVRITGSGSNPKGATYQSEGVLASPFRPGQRLGFPIGKMGIILNNLQGYEINGDA